MTSKTPTPLEAPDRKLVLRAAVYYVLLASAGALLWRYEPEALRGWSSSTGTVLQDGLSSVTDSASPSTLTGKTAAPTVIVAMLAALLLSIPVAWVYLMTRAKRGYQQSVVQLLIILPIVVAGIVVMVKTSLALAFSLAGIVAAVRFRNTLEDSKDAVYVFLATGIGLASAIDLPVAMAISLIFNVTVVVLWYTDFGSEPLELDGHVARKRLQRVHDMSKTGTFVAQMDSQVFRNMTKAQLEGVARRALRRARSENGEPEQGEAGSETCLRLRTRDVDQTRKIIESVFEETAKEWRVQRRREEADDITLIDYVVQLKKKTHPDDLLSAARTASGDELVEAELK